MTRKLVKLLLMVGVCFGLMITPNAGTITGVQMAVTVYKMFGKNMVETVKDEKAFWLKRILNAIAFATLEVATFFIARGLFHILYNMYLNVLF